MDIALIAKLITAAVAIVSVAKTYHEFVSGSKIKLRDEYRFAKEFLSDLETKKALHPYVVEKGYRALAGTADIKKEEVEYILTLENPARCLEDFVISRDYVEHLNTTGNLHIAFVKKYQRPWSRTSRKILYGVGYAIFGLIAFAPFIFATFLKQHLTSMVTSILITLPVFGYLAALCLREYAYILRSERLIKNQKNHTKRIVMPSDSR